MKNINLNDNTDSLTLEELSLWVNRFDVAERTMGTLASNALKKLYNYIGKDFLVWMARLYDPDTGCFYFSNSARDNEGFYPDCCSTSQVLDMLQCSQSLSRYDGKCLAALPKKTIERCVRYIRSLQSPRDGYFYHPQWGSGISADKRLSDMMQCVDILGVLGHEPLYPTFNVKLAATAERAANNGNFDANSSAVPSYLHSEADMLKYLESLNISANSYLAGSVISTTKRQILAMGLADVVCDYLDSIQNADTGLFEEGITCNAISGFVRLSNMYSAAGRRCKYYDRVAESSVEVLLSDGNTDLINFVINPFLALAGSIRGAEKENCIALERGEPPPYDVDAMRRIVYKKFPEIVDKTIEKLNDFRLPDGSYSFYRDTCGYNNMCVIVALRCKEGDVNATACVVYYMLNAIFGLLAIPPIPLANPADYEIVREIIETAEPVKKIPKAIRYLACDDMASAALTWRIVSGGGKKLLDLTYDPLRFGNRVLKWDAAAGTRSFVGFDGREFIDPPKEISAFEFECEILVPAKTEGVAYVLTLSDTGGNVAYMMPISIEAGNVVIYDTLEFGNPMYTDRIGTLCRVGEWARLTVMYYPGEHSARIKVYRNGVCVKESKNYYGNVYGVVDPVQYPTFGKLTSVSDVATTLYIDHMKTRLYVDKLYV